MQKTSTSRSLLSITAAIALGTAAGGVLAQDYDLPRMLVIGTPGTFFWPARPGSAMNAAAAKKPIKAQ